jgi:hypothetical protein
MGILNWYNQEGLEKTILKPDRSNNFEIETCTHRKDPTIAETDCEWLRKGCTGCQIRLRVDGSPVIL